MQTGTRVTYTKLYCNESVQGPGEPTESFTDRHVHRDQENLHEALLGGTCVYARTWITYTKLYWEVCVCSDQENITKLSWEIYTQGPGDSITKLSWEAFTQGPEEPN